VKVAVFSDLHLTTSASRRNRVFEELLQKMLPEIDELWLLGDIFDLFIGPYAFWQNTHKGIFTQLQAFTRRGGKVLWVEGNHDFHLGETLRETGVEVVDGELFRKVGDKRIWLGHGDLVNREDKAYLRWRGFTRSFGFRLAMRLVPEPVAERFLVPLGERLSHESRLRDRYDASLGEMYRDYARALFERGFDGVCLGHCHIRDLLIEDGRFYLNIGTWLDGEFQYGFWDTETSAHPVFKRA
jgi:UDP-2,3-diacylglucosamine hydrolase